MNISAQMVKELREKTNSGMMDCKKALQDADGDMAKAVEFLRQKGLATAMKRSGRETKEGIIASYIHSNAKIGVMVEVNCESDFVAKNEDFKEFAKNIAMHIAATSPLGISQEDIPADVIESEKSIFKAQAIESGKPENIAEKMVAGKLKKFYAESCLLEQAYVKNPDISVQDYLNEVIAKIGENISIVRFTRYQIGEESK